jgi:hypothetical protein
MRVIGQSDLGVLGELSNGSMASKEPADVGGTYVGGSAQGGEFQ